MKKSLFLLFVLLGFFSFSQSLKPIAQKIENAHSRNLNFEMYSVFVLDSLSKNLNQYQKSASDISVLQVVPKQLNKIVREKPETLSLKIPYNHQELWVELIKNTIYTDDFSVQTSEGKTINYQPGVYYQGIVKGDNTSVVAISIFEDNVIGVVSKLNIGNIVIGKVKDSQDFVSYSDTSLTGKNPFVCETDEIMKTQKQKISFDPQNPNNKAITTNCVRIYYEICKAPYVNNASNVTQTTNWISAIHNNIQTLYTNDDIKIAMSSVYIWTTTDPYTGTYSQNLAKFKQNRPTFNGDLAHLVNYPATTSVAYVNSLCTTSKHAYSGISMTYNQVPTYSWTILAMTHEMGHSMGSPHTHACAWNGNDTAIDGCGPTSGNDEGCTAAIPTNGGTIMSYCHLVSGVGTNFANGFGPQPSTLIRNTVDSKACLGTNCTQSCTITVTNVGTNNVTINSANATIVDATSSNWKYRLRKLDNTVIQSGNTSNTALQFTGLLPNTYYFLDIGTDCSGPNAYQKTTVFMTDDNWCEGKIFTDSGGETSGYENNMDFVKTFYPSTAGGKIIMSFTDFDLEQDYDFMTIYDGPSTGSPVFANGNQLTGLLSPISFTSTDISGAITVKFTSDVYLANAGWKANVNCLLPLATQEVLSNSSLEVYPNPVKNILSVHSKEKIQSFVIYDAAGRRILFNNELKNNQLDIDVHELTSGNYIISIKTNEGVHNKKFVKN